VLNNDLAVFGYEPFGEPSVHISEHEDNGIVANCKHIVKAKKAYLLITFKVRYPITKGIITISESATIKFIQTSSIE
jgi:hypothetical protein